MTELRDFAIKTLERLGNREIECSEAGVTAKLCESVILTVKTELEYARMLGEEPAIPFLSGQDSNKKLTYEGTVDKKGLPSPKR